MSVKINEIKKHLKRGDLKKIAEDNGFTYSLVIAVFNDHRKNTKVLEAIISKAEQNKLEEEQLISRTKKLKK